MIICAGEIESFLDATSIGIGLIDTAINLTNICNSKEIDELIFVGSAGSYGKYEILDLVTTSSTAQIEHSFLSNSSYTIIKNKIVSHETDPIVNSSNYITTDEKISKEYLKAGVDLENMEFFSVASVAKKYNIPFKGIFVVTNYCNKDAHEEFIKNHKRAKEILENYIKSIV